MLENRTFFLKNYLNVTEMEMWMVGFEPTSSPP